MKRFIVLTVMAAAAAGLCVNGCATEQSTITCRAAHGGFAVKYTLKEGQTVGPACNVIYGEVIGISAYHPAKDDNGAVKPDQNKATLAIRTSTLGNLEGGDPNPDNLLTSVGDLTPYPSDADVCFSPLLSMAAQHVPADPTADPPAPAVDITYRWRNVQVLDRFDIPGSIAQADLSYGENGCVLEYTALAMFPAVDCTGEDADGNAVPDDTLCSPIADPEHGRATGSGINPDFVTFCDPHTFLCVLKAPPPEFTQN